MAELKPCPFCGGNDLFVEESPAMVCGNHMWYIVHSASSKDCVLVNGFGEFITAPKFTTKEKAIEAWNRRAND